MPTMMQKYQPCHNHQDQLLSPLLSSLMSCCKDNSITSFLQDIKCENRICCYLNLTARLNSSWKQLLIVWSSEMCVLHGSVFLQSWDVLGSDDVVLPFSYVCADYCCSSVPEHVFTYPTVQIFCWHNQTFIMMPEIFQKLGQARSEKNGCCRYRISSFIWIYLWWNDESSSPD